MYNNYTRCKEYEWVDAMTENKTKPTDVSVDEFIDTAAEPRRSEARRVVAIMREVTGVEPVMWGPSMIGFGSYHYKYESGREGDMLKVGFSPRKAALVLYGLVYYDEHEQDNDKLLEKLGPHTRGKGCVYVKKLADIDESILRTMIRNAYSHNSS